MCYAKPGPRCYSHYEQPLEKNMSAIHAAYAEFDALKDSEKQGIAISEKEKKQAQKKIMDIRAERLMLKNGRDATRGGIDRLKHELTVNAHEMTSEDKLEAEERINIAVVRFEDEMYEFDKLNNTVNGKKPSRAFDHTDIYRMSQDLRKSVTRHNIYVSELKSSNGSMNDDEVKVLRNRIQSSKGKIKSLQNKMDHATITATYVANGDIEDPRKSEDWNKKAKEYEVLQKRAKTENTDPSRIEYYGNLAHLSDQMSKLSAKGYKANMPVLLDSKGNQTNHTLRYNDPQSKWEWTDGQDEFDYVDGDTSFRKETYSTIKKPQPAKYTMLTRPNGKLQVVLVPNLERINKLKQLNK